MNFKLSCSVIIALSIAVIGVSSTEVKQCPKSKAPALDSSDVTISACPKNKCVLKRNTEPTIEMKIRPTRDFTELTSDIQGIILDVPLPFPGYFGTSACPFIFDEAGTNQVGCPLKAGETYTYKNSFKVLSIYPTVSLDIHWGLGDKEGDVVCFEIPAKIKA